MCPETARRVEPWLVVGVAVHSYAVAAALLLLPQWGADLGGWGRVEPPFFVRQSGIFHCVVATGYLVEYFRWRSIDLLLLAKGLAVAFLVAMTILDRGPWAVPMSAAGDALMGAAALWIHRRAAGPSGAGETAGGGRPAEVRSR